MRLKVKNASEKNFDSRFSTYLNNKKKMTEYEKDR